jgi:uncharacterized protein (TIGR02996 family)
VDRFEERWGQKQRNALAQKKQRENEALERALAERADAGFLQAIWQSPADTHRRLVYADWLEEQGQAPQARFVRLESEIEALPPGDAQRSQLERDRDALLSADADRAWLTLWRHVRTTCMRCGEPLPAATEEYCARCGAPFSAP